MVEKLWELLHRVNQVEVSCRWYYDIGVHTYNELKMMAQQYKEIHTALDESLQMNHWYGHSYLVPVDLLPSIDHLDDLGDRSK